MVCWTDGGWNHQRGIGFASVMFEGSSAPIVQPVFDTQGASTGCEARALILAVVLTDDDPSVEIRSDCQGVLDMVSGKAPCSVVELVPYIRWLRRNVGSRTLVWVPRAENMAHVSLPSLFESDDHWHSYEMSALRERKQQG